MNCYLFFLTALIFSVASFAQSDFPLQGDFGKLTKQYEKSADFKNFDLLSKEFGQFKELPTGFELQALVALSHYPKLKNTPIHFVFKKGKVAHTSRPKIGSIFKAKQKRTYVITISNEIKPTLENTRLENLSYNAQIGVLGHELAHIVDYSSRNFFELISFGLHYIKKKDIIKTENQTDLTTIKHGLGYQLLQWSKEVHDLHIADGRGELYLSPEAIVVEIGNNLIYK